MDLEGSVAIVTGAASGIGRATAVAFAHAGADVDVAVIEPTDHVVRDVEAAGRTALSVPTDVTKREEVEALVRRAIDWQGRVDIYVSNAGVGCIGAPEDFTPDEWEYALAVNLWSAIWPLRLVVPHMRERGRGRLVFVSSGAGFEGFADRAPYNVAKFGIVGLAEAVARSLQGSGAGVSLVVPGAVSTDGWKRTLVAGSDPDETTAVREQQRPFGEAWPRPESMAEVIVRGIREDRYCIVQYNPHEPGWFANINAKKGRDPDAFVLGS